MPLTLSSITAAILININAKSVKSTILPAGVSASWMMVCSLALSFSGIIKRFLIKIVNLLQRNDFDSLVPDKISADVISGIAVMRQWDEDIFEYRGIVHLIIEVK